MAFCTNCGKKLPDGAIFCENCGAPVPAPQNAPQNVPHEISRNGSESVLQDTTQSASSDVSAELSQEAAYRQGSLLQDESAPQAFQQTSHDQQTSQEIHPSSGSRKKPVAPIILGIAAVLAVIWFILKPSGWSTADAQAATQARLDEYFLGDSESLAKHMDDTTVEDLDAEREEMRQEMIDSTFKSTVPVTQELKTRYADFFLSLMEKARYEVGEASKTEDGFEVPVKVWPITSLAHGDYVLLDMQLNDELSDAELNERFYSRELELMTELIENPTYGDPQVVIVHITKGEDSYEFSKEDDHEIIDMFYTRNRHWTKERTKKAVEAVLGGVYKEQYEELARWTVATQDEIEDAFGLIFAKDTLKSTFNELTDQMTSDMELEKTYEIPDEILENLSVAFRVLLSGTDYEVTSIRGEEEEYIADLQITPIKMEPFEDELLSQLEAEIETFSTPEELLDRFWELMSGLLLQAAESGEHGEPVHRTLHLRFNDNQAYALDYDEFSGLFDTYSEDSDQEDVDAASSSDSESSSADEEDKTEDSSASASERYASGKEIPLLVQGKEVVLGETSVQEFLDETGLTIDESADTIKAEDYEEIEIETGDEDTYLSLMIKKDASTKDIKECSIYEVTYSDYSPNKGQNALVFFGGLTVGSTPDEVREVFGRSDYDDEYSVSYYMDDDTYSLYFAHEDGIVEYMSFERMFY